MEDQLMRASRQNTDDLLRQWQSKSDEVKESLAGARKTVDRMGIACKSPSDSSASSRSCEDMEADSDSDFELRRPSTSSDDNSNSSCDPSQSLKLARESLGLEDPARLRADPLKMDISGELSCADTETSLSLMRRRKTVHEIPQIIINTPEGTDKFKRRRSTGEVVRSFSDTNAARQRR
ncbi:uncharacterized protein LOC100901508 [Galendromus occidentalis]|uniref:Uncharacterized protein LOC100901508 n=1 Tax=Galendromus occidentalis TaxID=34638 RepID=A0AAJ7L7T5_9ACAR|nr:uncharacterized protein LOC100901508 [Galendromus occidentalis]